MSLITVTLTLFLIMDAFGNISSFLKLTEGLPSKRQNFIVFREMGFALLFMIFFNYFGEWIFVFLNLSETAVMLSAGLILFFTAIKIIYPTEDSPRANLIKGEPFIVPLAVPLISGPSLLATIMLYAHAEESASLMLTAIFIAWALSIAVLLSSSVLNRVLGSNGLIAVERLLALILIMLATQRFMEGVQLFIKSYG